MPMMSSPFPNDNLPSLAEIPASTNFKDSSRQQPNLAAQLLRVFEKNKIPLSTQVKEGVREIAGKHDRYIQVRMGRGSPRVAITQKSEEIARLQQGIVQLEADRQLLQELAESQDDGL